MTLLSLAMIAFVLGAQRHEDIGARRRYGGRPYTMTPTKLRLAQAAMVDRDTKVGDLYKESGVTRQTLYRFVGPKGELRPDGAKLRERKRQQASL